MTRRYGDGGDRRAPAGCGCGTPTPDNTSAARCHARCLDPEAVTAAAWRLAETPVVSIPYTCKLSGREELVRMLSDPAAVALRDVLPGVQDSQTARVLAALAGAELCECDVATLLSVADHVAAAALDALGARGVITHRMLDGMHCYRVTDPTLREAVDTALARGCGYEYAP